MLFDQAGQQSGVRFDFLAASEAAELDMLMKEIKFDAQANKRKGNQYGFLPQVIQTVTDAFLIQIVQEGEKIAYTFQLHCNVPRCSPGLKMPRQVLAAWSPVREKDGCAFLQFAAKQQ